MNDTTDNPPETSDTVEGLAEKHCFDTKELDKTVDRYNAAMKGEQFDLMKLDGKSTTGLKPNTTNWANPIGNASFYGYPMTANSTSTYVTGP